jgi:hypothetical protein
MMMMMMMMSILDVDGRQLKQTIRERKKK